MCALRCRVRSGWTAVPLLCGLVLNMAVAAGQSAGTVSAQELRHKVSRKANAALRKALKFYRDGDRRALMNQLQVASQMPDAAPYAAKFLGVIHLNEKQLPLALVELKAAAEALPWDAEAQGLLAYVCYGVDENSAGADAAERALHLDPNSAIGHLAMAMILFDESRELAGLEHLQKAARDLVPARVALASYYQRTGHTELAERMLRMAKDLERQTNNDRIRRSAFRPWK